MTPRPRQHDTVEVVGEHPMKGRTGEVVEVQRATGLLQQSSCSVRIGTVRWAIPDEKLRVVTDPPPREVQYWDPEKAPEGVRPGPTWHQEPPYLAGSTEHRQPAPEVGRRVEEMAIESARRDPARLRGAVEEAMRGMKDMRIAVGNLRPKHERDAIDEIRRRSYELAVERGHIRRYLR